MRTQPSFNKTVTPQNSGIKLQFLNGHRRFISLDQLLRFEAANNYTNCYFRDGSQLLVSITLGRLLDRLPDPCFVRTHSKYAVNRQYVAGVLRTQQVVRLVTGEEIPISRRRVRDLLTNLPLLVS